LKTIAGYQVNLKGNSENGYGLRFDLVETFCSNQDLEGFFPTESTGNKEVVGRVSLEIESILDQKRIQNILIEKRAKARSKSTFFKKWKKD